MVNEPGNEVTTVTQPTQHPALGEGNVAGAGPIINAREPTPGQTTVPPVATQGAPAYVVTYYTGQLLAAQQKVARLLNARAIPWEQRTQAQAFFEFLENPQNDLQDLNGDDSTVFTALVAVPDSHKVKVIYGLSIGTAGIRQISPIARKVLLLFGEGGGILGPAQALLLDADITRKCEMKNLTKEETTTVFESGQHTVDQQVLRRKHDSSNHENCKPRLGAAHGLARRFHDEDLRTSFPSHMHDRKLEK